MSVTQRGSPPFASLTAGFYCSRPRFREALTARVSLAPLQSRSERVGSTELVLIDWVDFFVVVAVVSRLLVRCRFYGAAIYETS